MAEAAPLLIRLAARGGVFALALCVVTAAAAQPRGFHPVTGAPAAPAVQAPARVVDGRLRVTRAALAVDPATGMLDLPVVFDDPPPAAIDPDDGGAVAELMRQRMRAPGVAGNHGDLYDNRDRGHSRLSVARHPGMASTRYDDEARRAGLDQSLNTRLRFGAPTIGNASLAVTAGPLWRSLPRLAMTTRGAMEHVARLYEANHLYVYPAHADVGGTHGDLMPANTPYFVVSRGASRSDQPFVAALARIYAAYRPEVKTRLKREGLLASTTQMILRRGMTGAGQPEAYMSGRAHPSAFDPEAIRVRAMIRFANDMTADEIPPMVRLRVAEETALGPRNDLFADGLDEALFDTPGAVARFAQGSAGVRRYVLDVAGTVDPNGRPLRFHWRLLRGDPARTRVVALDAQGLRAMVEVRSPERAVTDADRRIDVGVFADNGRHLSAPAFFTVGFPLGQRRALRADGAPLWIDYRLEEGAYADPALEPRRDWRDDYLYDDDGGLTGWNRRTSDVERFYDAKGRTAGPDAAPVTPIYRILQRNRVGHVREERK